MPTTSETAPRSDLEDPPAPGSDAEWLSPWLNWLEEVETTSGIRDFGSFTAKGEERMDRLHEMWAADKTPREAADWLEAEINGPT
jgi:hypothetical protein